MTRKHTTRPVWAWHCDTCGRTGDELAFNQLSLPSAEAMRARGWFVSDVGGDKCLDCRVRDDAATPGGDS